MRNDDDEQYTDLKSTNMTTDRSKPTNEKINIYTVKETISSEVDSTLCQIIKKGITTTAHTPKRNPTSDTSLTSRRKQSSDFKNNNLNLILIYKVLIMFSTQRYTQNSSYNPITYKTLYIQNNSTSLKETAHTYIISTIAMT